MLNLGFKPDYSPYKYGQWNTAPTNTADGIQPLQIQLMEYSPYKYRQWNTAPTNTADGIQPLQIQLMEYSPYKYSWWSTASTNTFDRMTRFPSAGMPTPDPRIFWDEPELLGRLQCCQLRINVLGVWGRVLRTLYQEVVGLLSTWDSVLLWSRKRYVYPSNCLG